MITYFNGKFVNLEKVRISPEDRGFMFGDSLYEVIRSYYGKLFKIKEHLKRLSFGAKELEFNVTNFDFIEDVLNELIKINGLKEKDAVIYIQVTRGVSPRSHKFPQIDTPLTIFASAKEFIPYSNNLKNGINVILVPDFRWARCNIKTTNLLANTLMFQKANNMSADEAIFIRDGFVMEGTHTNFFVIKNGIVKTPPKTNYILPGITRELISDICKDLSIPYTEEVIFENELKDFDEMFVTGTTSEITPVVKINMENVKDGSPGLITKKLQDAFFQITKCIE